MIKKRFFKTKDECEVTFEIAVPGAEAVELMLSSNHWQPTLMREWKANHFRVSMRLPVDSRTEFRYRVDGHHWLDDPDADGHVGNVYGTTNGIVDTARPAS